MSRKRCKRIPRVINTNIINYVVESASKIRFEDFDRLRIMELGQIESLATGVGTLADLKGLSECLNLCETMADLNIGPEAKPACAAAQEAILSIMRRFERWKKVEATPSELQTLREVYAYHDLQRQSISRGQYEKAITTTANRIRSKHPSCVEVA